mgnify:CR=1 FL=1
MNRKNSSETKAAKMVNGGFERIFLVLLALSLAFGLQAQKEQKILVTSNYTADRSSTKKYRDGQPLKDVEVRINDMTTYVKTDKQGVASVGLLKSANQYRITSIEKKNYELAGAKNVYNNMQLYQAEKPLRLIMVSTADKDKVVSRLRKEIDSLRTENKRLLVAKERTDSAFFKVEEDIERLEASIFDRALEYLGRDLSLLDSANLEAQLHIMEGNYEAAEQTLPNIYELIAMYNRLKDLHKASIQTEYNTFETYITAFTATLQFDSAAHYAMMRADRYENDIQAQFAAGSFLKDFACNYDLALKYYNRALHIAEKNNDVMNMAKSYNNIALTYNNQGDYTGALEYFNKALNIFTANLSEDHINLATSYNNIGLALFNKGQYDKALEYYNKALKIQNAKSTNNRTDIATSYINISKVYHKRHEYNKALELLNKALEIQKADLEDNHIALAISFNNMGNIYLDKGEYHKALEYFDKALEIRKAKLGDNHIDVATCYSNLGSLYTKIGEYDTALEYYQKDLEIRKTKFGEDHINLATSYNNIGLALFNKGQYDKALEYYNKALKICLAIFDENNIELVALYNNMGSLYAKRKKYSKALKYYNKVLAIQEINLDEDHIDLATSYNNIGSLYSKKGKYNKALKYHNKALEIKKTRLGEQSIEVAYSYNNIGVALYYIGAYDNALLSFDAALKIYNLQPIKDIKSIETCKKNIENVHKAIEKAKDAENSQYMKL